LLAVYGLVGIIASLLLSPEPLVALYWSTAYVSVLVVLGAILSSSDPLACVRHVINLNWLVVGAVCVITVAVSWNLLFVEGLPVSEGLESPMMSGYVAYTSMPEIIGMPMVRATGVARYAAVLGIVSLCKLWHVRKVWGLI